jgi:hypothetical protein
LCLEEAVKQLYMYLKNMGMLDLAVTHLNTSVGPVLSSVQLAAVLRSGLIDTLSESPEAAAAASYLFVEIEPRVIALCVLEAGTDLDHANALYESLLRDSLPRVPAWEEYVSST